MKNTITRVDALNFAIDTINTYCENDTAVCDILAKIRDGIANRKTSDTAKANAKAKRANARADRCASVIPLLREAITTDMTAKEIFEASKERLPQDFTAAKVQNILLREMATELVKTETKNKANTYRLA